MKKQKLNLSLLLSLLLLIGLSNTGFATDTIKKVLVQKQFDVNKGVVLKATHEFGKVYCKIWDQPVISVKITAKIEKGNEDKIDDILDEIVTKVNGNKDEVTALCTLTSSFSKLTSHHVELLMEIMMPDWTRLKLNHSYGSAWVGKLTADVNIKSRYGSVTAESLSGEKNQIFVSFGKGTFDRISNANIDLSYGKIEIEECNDAILDCKYSDLVINKANNIKGHVEGGHLSLDQVNSLDGKSNFSVVKIGSLSNTLIWDMNYGGITIDKIMKGFSIVTLKSDYGVTKLGFAEDVNTKLNLSVNNGGISMKNQNVHVLKDIKETLDHHIEGLLGNKKNPSAEVTVESNYGSIRIY